MRQAGQRAAAGARVATPYGVIALLAASAVAPVAGVMLGATGELAAVLGQLGGVGSNYLAETLTSAAQRMGQDQVEPDEWRDAIAAELLARMSRDDAAAAALRDEIGLILRSVEAVDVALRTADDDLRHELVEMFAAVGEDTGSLRVLAEDAAASLSTITRQLAAQGHTQRTNTDLLRQSLVATAQLRQELVERVPRLSGPLVVQTSGGDEPGVAATDGAGATTTGDGSPDAAADAPYPGLVSFEATNARNFYGREGAVAVLLGRLNEHILGGPPLILVGVSGAGKSSLLRAGVLAAVAGGALGSESVAWPWLVVTPGPAPLAELTARLAPLAGVDAAIAYEQVSADPAALGKLAAQAGGDGRLILVVDQFEELFTRCESPADRLAFAAALAAAAPALLVIAVRADFYPHCTELPPMLPMLESGQFVVGPLSTRQLRRAVRSPALDNGLQLEAGLAELILADLGIRPGLADEDRAGYEPGALPLLAHVLRVTWERREGHTMTVAGYGRAGGIRHAVAETAERIYLDLDPQGRAALRSALLSLVTIVDGMTIRRTAPATEADVAVLRRLIAARLVTADKSAVTISHEALLTGWPRLATWVAQAREEILLHQRLAQATAEWTLAGEDPDLLWRGALLATAIDPSDQRPNRPPDQQRFLAAGRTEAQRRQRLQERTSRRLRRLVIGLVAALLIAVGGAAVAVDQRTTAVNNGALAHSRELAAKARSELFIDPHDAIRDALDAWQTAPTTEAHSALVLAQQATLVGKLGSELNASSVSVSPDGRFVAVGYYRDGRFQLWDATTLRQIGGDLHNPADNLLSLKFSPDSRYLAVGSVSADAGLTIWDTTGTMLHSLPAFGMPAWLPDSSAVLAIRSSGAPAGRLIGSWSPADGRLTGTVTAAVLGLNSIDVSSDGASVALAGGGDGQVLRRADGKSLVRIPGAKEIRFDGRDSVIVQDTAGVITSWELRKGRQVATLTGRYETPTTGHMAVSPGGTVVVQGPNEREILLLTTAGNGARPPLTGFDGAANDVALSGDGLLLAAVGPGGAPALMRLGVDRLPHPQVVGDLAFDDTGRRLATVSDDPVVRIWDPQTSRLTNRIAVGSVPLALDYAPDGSLAVALEDHTIVLLDPRGKPRGILRPDNGFFFSQPTFSPDGRLLAAVQHWVDTDNPDDDAKRQDEPGVADVMIWDAATLAPRVRLETTGHEAYAVAFDPDGSTVLATSNRNETDVLGASGPLQQGAVWSWRVADGMLLARHDMATGSLAGIRVSPDGTKVAVAAESGRAAIFDADSLRPLTEIGNHRDELKNVEFSPDGSLLVTASGSNDDVPKVWEVATGRLVTEIRGHNNALTALRFSPDGTILATAAEDWTVGLWRLDPAAAIRRLCAMLTPSANATGPALPAACT